MRVTSERPLIVGGRAGKSGKSWHEGARAVRRGRHHATAATFFARINAGAQKEPADSALCPPTSGRRCQLAARRKSQPPAAGGGGSMAGVRCDGEDRQVTKTRCVYALWRAIALRRRAPGKRTPGCFIIVGVQLREARPAGHRLIKPGRPRGEPHFNGFPSWRAGFLRDRAPCPARLTGRPARPRPALTGSPWPTGTQRALSDGKIARHNHAGSNGFTCAEEGARFVRNHVAPVNQ